MLPLPHNIAPSHGTVTTVRVGQAVYAAKASEGDLSVGDDAPDATVHPFPVRAGHAAGGTVGEDHVDAGGAVSLLSHAREGRPLVLSFGSFS